VLALGYESSVISIWEKVEEQIKEKLAKSRERNTIEQNFFFNKFNQKYEVSIS